MKIINFAIIILGFTTLLNSPKTECLDAKSLKALDASWEKAQLQLDYEFINTLLTDDFVWIHNHAKTIDDKPAVLNRVKRHLANNNRSTKSRISNNVEVIIHGKTGVVRGYTVIDRGPKPITYSFMRTYIEKNGKCYLIANHTMAIPDKNKE